VSSPVVGVFGGTFDPIHLAHLAIAQAFIRETGLNQLRLIPAGEPYHRADECTASAEHRLKMVQLAIADQPAMQADDREIRRNRPSYTIETLEEIRTEIGSQAPLWFLIGSDSLQRLDTWKRWPELFELAHLAVAMRPGFTEQDLPAPILQQWQTRQSGRIPNSSASGTIQRLVMPPLELSASAIRASLASDMDISHLVPPVIASYIDHHGLYRKGGIPPYC
jgi:nicotinate-nucleotide adenylyltransferase